MPATRLDGDPADDNPRGKNRGDGRHEHSALTYSKPASLNEGTLIRYGVDRRKNQLHSQISKDGGRGDGREIAVDRFIDDWHQRTTGERTRWEKPNRIFEGYCGALLDFKELSGGRLVCAFAW